MSRLSGSMAASNGGSQGSSDAINLLDLNSDDGIDEYFKVRQLHLVAYQA